MKRLVRILLCEIFTICKFCVLKLFHRSNFRFGFINICAINSEIDISRKGYLQLGNRFRMKSNCHIRVRNNAKVIVGKNVTWNYGCMCVAHETINIGDNVQFGPNVMIYDHDHDFRIHNGLNNKDFVTSPVEIGNNVWIGAGTIILRGTKIGDNCVIGAGSLLKGEYGPNQVLVQKRETKLIKIR